LNKGRGEEILPFPQPVFVLRPPLRPGPASNQGQAYPPQIQARQRLRQATSKPIKARSLKPTADAIRATWTAMCIAASLTRPYRVPMAETLPSGVSASLGRNVDAFIARWQGRARNAPTTRCFRSDSSRQDLCTEACGLITSRASFRSTGRRGAANTSPAWRGPRSNGRII
jgi:hypothetical protein